MSHAILSRIKFYPNFLLAAGLLISFLLVAGLLTMPRLRVILLFGPFLLKFEVSVNNKLNYLNKCLSKNIKNLDH